MKSGLVFNCIQELFSRAYSFVTGAEPSPLRSLLSREYEKLSPRRILDVGCGSGSFAVPDYDYVGIDPNANYVAYCRRHRPGRFEQMSAEKLEWFDEGRWFRREEDYVDLLGEEFSIAEKRLIVDQFYRTLVLSCRKKAT